MSSISIPQQEAVASTRLYRAVWRWHFYAGLIVVPFLAILAVSGLVILFVTGVAPVYGDWKIVDANGRTDPAWATTHIVELDPAQPREMSADKLEAAIGDYGAPAG